MKSQLTVAWQNKTGRTPLHELLTNMAHNKQQYEALPGKDGVMASEKPVLSQPTKLSPTEEYVLNLDPATVSGKFAFELL